MLVSEVHRHLRRQSGAMEWCAPVPRHQAHCLHALCLTWEHSSESLKFLRPQTIRSCWAVLPHASSQTLVCERALWVAGRHAVPGRPALARTAGAM